MADYKAGALAAWEAEQAALVEAVKVRLAPLFEDAAGKPVLDVRKAVTVLEDRRGPDGTGMVLLREPGGVTFGVTRNLRDEWTVQVLREVLGGWERSQPVATMGDVGRVLAGWEA